MMIKSSGEVTEWLMVAVLKTAVGRPTASSNLALSAMHSDPERGRFAWRRGLEPAGNAKHCNREFGVAP